MRIMLDTNIFISMIFFPSAQTRELARRLTESHQIVVCDYVIEELRLVTERKFPAKRKFLDRFFMELPFELVYTPKELDLNEFPEMRDVKDSPILATAIMEGIDVFLTGELLDTKYVGKHSCCGFQDITCKDVLFTILHAHRVHKKFTKKLALTS